MSITVDVKDRKNHSKHSENKLEEQSFFLSWECRLERNYYIYIQRRRRLERKKKIKAYCQIVSEELHDQSAIFVRLLLHAIQVGNGIFKRLQTHLGKMLSNPQCLRTRGAQETFQRTSVYLSGQLASLFGIVLDLIVEDREVEGQAQADGVCGWQVCRARCECPIISFLWFLNDLCRQKNSQLPHHTCRRNVGLRGN